MPVTYVGGVPGVRTERLGTARVVRKSSQGVKYVPGGVIINGSLSRDQSNTAYVDTLQPGLPMGKITLTGKYATSFYGAIATSYTTGTSLTVTAAAAAELSRRLTAGSTTFTVTGPATSQTGAIVQTVVTYSAVNTTTNVVTITDPTANMLAGSWIGGVDGSENPIGLIDDGGGIKVTDDLAVSQDQSFGYMLVGGDLDSSQIIGWPAAAMTTLVLWIKGKLNAAAGGYGFTFDDAYTL